MGSKPSLPLSDLGINASDFPSPDGNTHELDDGRMVGYKVYGCLDDAETKENIIFIPGTPGSRFFFPPSHSKDSAEHGVRVYVVERPGFGLSTPQTGRTLTSFAHDVAHFAKGLELGTYSVVGYSAGGPYALACAALRPEGLKRVVIVACVGPPDTPNIYSGMSYFFCIAWFVAQNLPFLIPYIVRSEANSFLSNSRHNLSKDIKSTHATVDSEDYENNPEIERAFIESGLELWSRPCGVEAEAQDYALFARDWGFDLSSIQVPVSQYFGGKDYLSVPNIAHHLASVIPHVHSKEMSECGHFVFWHCWQNIL
eukprot:775262_1